MTNKLPRFKSEMMTAISRTGLIVFGLLLPCIGGQNASAQAEKLNLERLFDSDHLLKIDIEIPKSDWDQLCKQTRDFGSAFASPTEKPFTYFKGNILINGLRAESVGIRKKGFIGSLDELRPSLKIKFDEFGGRAPIKDLDSLTLNNNKQDSAVVSQFLTYKIFNAAGLYAPRCNFARVTVNGTYLGVYSNVESIGKPFLQRRFGDSSGTLFEGTIADFYPRAIEKLEVKPNEKQGDRRKALRLAELLANSEELPLDKVATLVDIDYFVKFWALESLIGFWDGYTSNQNNFWVYDNPKNGKFYFIPWGADGCFMGVRAPFGFSSQAATSIYAESMLANRLYHTPGIADRYRSAMLGLLDTAWNEAELVATVDRLESLLREHLNERQSIMPRGMNSVRNFIRTRREKILEEFADWPVPVPKVPRKPMYTVDVGSVRGSFSTDWQEQAPENPIETGTAKLRMVLDGKEITFEKLGVQGGPKRLPFAGGPFGRADPQAGLVFTGIRLPDSEKLTLHLWVDRETFASGAGRTVELQGTLLVGKAGFNFFNPTANRSLAGEMKLTKVGASSGDPIAGEIDLKILETRGGFAAGRRELATPGADSKHK